MIGATRRVVLALLALVWLSAGGGCQDRAAPSPSTQTQTTTTTTARDAATTTPPRDAATATATDAAAAPAEPPPTTGLPSGVSDIALPPMP